MDAAKEGAGVWTHRQPRSVKNPYRSEGSRRPVSSGDLLSGISLCLPLRAGAIIFFRQIILSSFSFGQAKEMTR